MPLWPSKDGVLTVVPVAGTVTTPSPRRLACAPPESPPPPLSPPPPPLLPEPPPPVKPCPVPPANETPSVTQPDSRTEHAAAPSKTFRVDECIADSQYLENPRRTRYRTDTYERFVAGLSRNDT